MEVRFSDLSVEAECQVIHGKPIPTLWNTIKGILSVSSIKCICYVDLDMERFAASMFFNLYLSSFGFVLKEKLDGFYRNSFVQRKKPR